jgi:ABC-2 type transport system ATP-binding protein
VVEPVAGAPAIRVDHLAKRYGATEALREVSFAVEPGEMFGLLGPNGAGKTTLISIVTGLVRRTSGGAEVFGLDVTRHYKITRSLIGVVPQELVYDHFFTVRRALEIHSGYYGVRENVAWIDHLLDRLDLAPHADKKILALSGGMKRRLLVAKALVHRPQVLILDEPTAGVDVGLRQTLWEFVREIHASGTTVLLTTHYIEEAEEHCSRIGIIHEGRLVALDRTSNLLSLLSEKHVALTLAEPLAEVPEALARLGAQRSADGTRLTVTVHRADGDLSELMGALQGSGLPVRDLEVRRADLEDVFLHLTRGGRAREARP